MGPSSTDALTSRAAFCWWHGVVYRARHCPSTRSLAVLLNRKDQGRAVPDFFRKPSWQAASGAPQHRGGCRTGVLPDDRSFPDWSFCAPVLARRVWSCRWMCRIAVNRPRTPGCPMTRIIHRHQAATLFRCWTSTEILLGGISGNTAQLIPRFSRRVNKNSPDGTFRDWTPSPSNSLGFFSRTVAIVHSCRMSRCLLDSFCFVVNGT